MKKKPERKSKSNKEIEQYYFEKFSFPFGEIAYSDKPDVISESHGRKIGIEITNFYIKDGSSLESEQRQRELRNKAISQAQECYRNDGGKKIEVTFGFDEEKPIKKTKRLINAIVKLARKIENRKSGQIDKTEHAHIPELSFVYLYAEDPDKVKWRVQQVYAGQVISNERLCEIVKAKEQKVGDYQRCDEYWLLVVIDFFNPAQDQEIPINGLDKICSDKFEKIIVYRTVFEEVVELK